MTTLHNCKKLSRQLLVQQGLLVKAFLKIAVLEIGSFNDFRKKVIDNGNRNKKPHENFVHK